MLVLPFEGALPSAAAPGLVAARLRASGRFLVQELPTSELPPPGPARHGQLLRAAEAGGVHAVVDGRVIACAAFPDETNPGTSIAPATHAECFVEVRAWEVDGGATILVHQARGAFEDRRTRREAAGTGERRTADLVAGALTAAIADAEGPLVEHLARVAWWARVEKVSPQRVYIGAGRRSGLAVEDVLAAVRLEPDGSRRPLGEVRVVDFFGEDAAICVPQGPMDLRTGDRVRPAGVSTAD